MFSIENLAKRICEYIEDCDAQIVIDIAKLCFGESDDDIKEAEDELRKD